LDYSIRDHSLLLYHLVFIVGLAEERVIYHGTEAEVLSSIPPGHIFSSAMRNNSHLPCCLLSTHMARAHSCDSHVEWEILDYSIRNPLAPYISLGFYGWTGREESSSTNMNPYSRSYPLDLPPSSPKYPTLTLTLGIAPIGQA
jgi:hypothetical protein